MSNTYNTLADLVKLNDMNAVDLGVTDLLNDAPVLAKLAAAPASNGTIHNYIKTTSAPVVGFRAVNTGKYNGATGYTEVAITLQNMDGTFLVDLQLADSYKGGADAFVGRESKSAIKQMFFYFEQQIWYGTGAGDSSGFTGLGDNSLFSALAGANVVTAGGTTANTGNSVWLYRTTDDEQDMTAIIGNDGQIKIGETSVSLKADDTTPAKTYPVYLTPIQGHCGIQIGSVNSVVRIANITQDSGHTLTDKLISSAIAKFPANKGPTYIAMNRQSLQQLQNSRTATNPTGAPAPFPEESFGVPIIVTDSLSKTEALLT